jgi:exodeoxyribonuclease VII small subunit
MTTPTPPSSTPPSPTFEQALAEIETIVRDLEDGKIGLEESLRKYEQGVLLLKTCYGQLRQAELKIQELIGVDENGEARLRPFDHAASLRESK